MKIIAFIPLRKGSKRIKNKNIKKIAGIPLYQHVTQKAIKSKYISKVVIASDIINLNLPKNKKLELFKRSKNNATDKSQTEEVVREYLEKNLCDYCILIQATNIFLQTEDLDKAIYKMLNSKYDSLLSVVKSIHFFWKLKNNKLIPINYDFKKRPFSQQNKSEEYIENGSFYIFKRKNFLKFNNRLHGKITYYEMDKKSIFEIDDPEDLDIVKKIMKE